jgi:hypothetical protein
MNFEIISKSNCSLLVLIGGKKLKNKTNVLIFEAAYKPRSEKKTGVNC